MRLHLGVGPQFTGLVEDVNVTQNCLNIQYYFAMDGEISRPLDLLLRAAAEAALAHDRS